MMFGLLRRLKSQNLVTASSCVALWHSNLVSSRCDAPLPYDSLQGKVVSSTYNANNPTEDRHVVAKDLALGGGGGSGWFNMGRSAPWNICAVFDGHGGWQVAQMASERLVEEIVGQIKPRVGEYRLEKANAVVQTGPDSNSMSNTAGSKILDQCIFKSFKIVEQEYLDKVRESYALGFGEVAKVGCCALVAIQREKELVVANLGDCRAVLGSANKDSKDQTRAALATRLTSDHNARMPLELLQLQLEHPGEDDVVVCKSPTACYVKGRLQLTRALGDAYLKYPEFNGLVKQHHRGRHIPQPYTAPYVKSVPDVAHFSLSEQDRFLVLASDGLWDFLEDAEAVDIVDKAVRSGKGDQAAALLVEAALQRAAVECGMSIEQLKACPPGGQRRNRHDDTTAVVMYF